MKSLKLFLLILGIAAAFMLAGGIPLIVFSCIGGIKIFRLIVGILFVLFGFYGMPFIWIAYGRVSFADRLLRQILRDNTRSIKQLARINARNAASVVDEVNDMIKKGRLAGYVIHDDYVMKQSELDELLQDERERREELSRISVVKCENCGSVNRIVGRVGFCEYCGTPLAAPTATEGIRLTVNKKGE